jgi:hypothetical protein
MPACAQNGFLLGIDTLPLFQVGAMANPTVVTVVEHIIFMSQVLESLCECSKKCLLMDHPCQSTIAVDP